jgi:hypothetical protein
MSLRLSHRILGGCLALAVLAVAGANVLRSMDIPRANPVVVLAPSVAEPWATGTPGPACDRSDDLMSAMFVGLTAAVLSTSDVDREALIASIGEDRELLRTYIGAFGVQPSEADLDRYMGLNLLGVAGSTAMTGAC